MRSRRLVDFGKTMWPRCRCQRMTTCAGRLAVRVRGIRRSRAARAAGTCPARADPTPRSAMPCSSAKAVVSGCWWAGCSSIWSTAGTTSVSSSSRSRCGTRKFETPIERARPRLADRLERPPRLDVAVAAPASASGSGRGRRSRVRAARGSRRTRRTPTACPGRRSRASS